MLSLCCPLLLPLHPCHTMTFPMFPLTITTISTYLARTVPHSHCPLSAGILHQFLPSSVWKSQMQRRVKLCSCAYSEVVSEAQHWRPKNCVNGYANGVALQWTVPVSLRDRVRSSAIREGLGVEPLLLCVERGQLRWFGQLMRMPPGRLPREVFLARPTGRRPRGRPRTRWRGYISSLSRERLGIPQSELAGVAGEREVWGSLLKMLPPRPDFG